MRMVPEVCPGIGKYKRQLYQYIIPCESLRGCCLTDPLPSQCWFAGLVDRQTGKGKGGGGQERKKY